MKDIVNVKIKFREPFRPFAPSVLSEMAVEYFQLLDPPRHYPARFMLYVVDVKDTKRDLIPAVTHVDGTARLQTVSKETNPRYYTGCLGPFRAHLALEIGYLKREKSWTGNRDTDHPQHIFQLERRTHCQHTP